MNSAQSPSDQSTNPRFAFGANWARFLASLTDERIRLAELSLTDWLGALEGKSFLDIGSGSGLFSLAARNMGASVHSFDYDADSVACTAELRRRYHPNDPEWRVEQGNALDEPYLRSLGTFDVVYSWGVLHHTGNMWKALEMATIPLAGSGRLYIALYNRLPPLLHRLTLAQKRAYVRGPAPIRWALIARYGGWITALEIAASLYHGRPPLARIRDYGENSRGMSWWTDIVDWVGGYPYESATPEDVFEFGRVRGFNSDRHLARPGHGCNEFLFSRSV